MKRWFVAVSLFAATTAGLVTGCSGTQPANTQNEQNATISNQPSANTTGSNTGATNSATSNSASDAQVIAQFKTVAKGLVQRYVSSHNDKSLQTYKVDVNQLLIPGLAQVVGEAAKKGVDYANPVQASSITVSNIEPQNNHLFRAQVVVQLKYGTGKSEKVTYHVMCTQDPSTQQWLIQSIA